MIPTLPLAPRNRLAELIIEAVHDAAARAELSTLATSLTSAATWITSDDPRHAHLAHRRARAAAHALEREPLWPRDLGLGDVLRAAAVLFDAGLHFEVHDLLEPHWGTADGPARQALQGLIQVAVGYQHHANGNLRGAVALLGEGSERLETGALPGLDLVAFAAAVRASLANSTFAAPHFPRPARAA